MQNIVPQLVVNDEEKKKLMLPQPPRVIKKAKRQRNSLGNREYSTLSIKVSLEAIRGDQPCQLLTPYNALLLSQPSQAKPSKAKA